jgi:hypothetical protein
VGALSNYLPEGQISSRGPAMKKLTMCILAITALLGGILLAQEKDITGTWQGTLHGDKAMAGAVRSDHVRGPLFMTTAVASTSPRTPRRPPCPTDGTRHELTHRYRSPSGHHRSVARRGESGHPSTGHFHHRLDTSSYLGNTPSRAATHRNPFVQWPSMKIRALHLPLLAIIAFSTPAKPT